MPGDMADFALDTINFEDRDRSESRVTCRCCGANHLHWKEFNGRWRLFDDNGLHACPVAPLKAGPACRQEGAIVTTDPVVLQAISCYDQYHTLLHKTLRVLSPETVSTWLETLSNRLEHSPDMEERLEANAMLVGILTVMLAEIKNQSKD